MIPKYSVKRPYTVLVAVVLVIVLGVVSLTRMTTDLLPAMNLPYVFVVTTDVGASPEEVEKDVTSPIEEAMATTCNINNVSSMSYDNYSMVVLEYEQGCHPDPPFHPDRYLQDGLQMQRVPVSVKEVQDNGCAPSEPLPR